MKNRLSIAILLLCSVASVSAHERKIENNTQYWLNVDVLCLKPHEKSLVLTNKKTDLFSIANVTVQPTIKPHFSWDFGSRIGFGYKFANQIWDVSIDWTHYTSHVQQQVSTHGDIGLGMFPIWSLADDIIPFDWVSQAKLRWHLNLNLVDLNFGRTFACNNRFLLRTLIGIRATSIHQKYRMLYGGGIFANGLNLADLDSTFGYDTMSMKNNFWGIGPRCALEPQINLGSGFYLYAGAYGTLNYGRFNICQQEIYLKSLRYKNNCHVYKLRWILDATGGIAWNTLCTRYSYALTLKFGWEYHLFFDQVALKGDRFGLVSNDRNLALNGFAFSARFDF